jgi:hypothetical protein
VGGIDGALAMDAYDAGKFDRDRRDRDPEAVRFAHAIEDGSQADSAAFQGHVSVADAGGLVKR